MKIFLTIMIFSFTQLTFGQQIDREIFEATLGKEKAYTYTMLERSFEEFLKLNYQTENSLSGRIKGYLTDIENENINWAFNDSLNTQILEQLEQTGLRKDILLYKNEIYKERFDFENYIKENTTTIENNDLGEIEDDFEEIIEIPTTNRKKDDKLSEEELVRQRIRDKIPYPNKDGRFYYALAKAQTNHEDIKAYVSMVTKYEESPSPALITSAFLKYITESELISWENKLIMIVEIYLKSMIQYELVKK